MTQIDAGEKKSPGANGLGFFVLRCGRYVEFCSGKGNEG